MFLTGFGRKSYNLGSTMADVAQLVESQIVILVVAGSSPVVRPTIFSFLGSDLGPFLFLCKAITNYFFSRYSFYPYD